MKNIIFKNKNKNNQVNLINYIKLNLRSEINFFNLIGQIFR